MTQAIATRITEGACSERAVSKSRRLSAPKYTQKQAAAACAIRPKMPRPLPKTMVAPSSLTREYGVDPLEMVSVTEVMSELPEPCVNGDGRRSAVRFPEVPSPEIYAYADETCRRRRNHGYYRRERNASD